MIDDSYTFSNNTALLATYREFAHKFSVEYNLESGITIKLMDIPGQPTFTGNSSTQVYTVTNMTQRIMVIADSWEGDIKHGGMTSVAQDSSNADIIIAKLDPSVENHKLTVTLEKKSAPSGAQLVPVSAAVENGETKTFNWYTTGNGVTLGFSCGGGTLSFDVDATPNMTYTTSLQLYYKITDGSFYPGKFYMDGSLLSDYGYVMGFNPVTEVEVFIRPKSRDASGYSNTVDVIFDETENQLWFKDPVISVGKNEYVSRLGILLVSNTANETSEE